jgi:PPOX class probable F420-dependent enzyme
MNRAPVPAPMPAPSAPAPAADLEDVLVPETHRDLLTRPLCGVLTTMFPSGQPHSTIVWVDWDGRCALVNTTLQRWVGRNLAANPKASLLVVDPDNTGRYVQIRGDVELVREGAIEQLDAVTWRYTRHPRFYGFVYPAEQQARDDRVIARLHARRVTVDAIHN